MSKFKLTPVKIAHARYIRACHQLGATVGGTEEAGIWLRAVNQQRMRLRRIVYAVHRQQYIRGLTDVMPHPCYLVFDSPYSAEHFDYKTDVVEHLRKRHGIGRNKARRVVSAVLNAAESICSTTAVVHAYAIAPGSVTYVPPTTPLPGATA